MGFGVWGLGLGLRDPIHLSCLSRCRISVHAVEQLKTFNLALTSGHMRSAMALCDRPTRGRHCAIINRRDVGSVGLVVFYRAKYRFSRTCGVYMAYRVQGSGWGPDPTILQRIENSEAKQDYLVNPKP